jgi:hypothetical protein
MHTHHSTREELMCRLNTKLEAADLEPMTDLVKDFSSGVKLIEVCSV